MGLGGLDGREIPLEELCLLLPDFLRILQSGSPLELIFCLQFSRPPKYCEFGLEVACEGQTLMAGFQGRYFSSFIYPEGLRQSDFLRVLGR